MLCRSLTLIVGAAIAGECFVRFMRKAGFLDVCAGPFFGLPGACLWSIL